VSRGQHLVLIGLVALALRLSVCAWAYQDPTRLRFFDSAEYEQLADSLRQYSEFARCPPGDDCGEVDGRVMDDEGRIIATAGPYRPEVRRTPLYPALLAACGNSHSKRIILLQCALGAMAAALAGAMLDSRGSAVCAGLFLACDVPSIAHCSLIASETLFATLVTSGVWLLIRGRKKPSWFACGGAGTALGLAVLCRPIGVYVLVLPAVWLCFGDAITLTRARSVTAYSIAGALVLAPWMVRNEILFGAPCISSIEGLNLFTYKAVYAETEPPATAERVAITRTRIHAEFAAALGDRRLNQVEISREYRQNALRRIGEHPSRYALACARGALTFFSECGTRSLWRLIAGDDVVTAQATTLNEWLNSRRQLPACLNALTIFAACWTGLIYLAAGRAMCRAAHDNALRAEVILLVLIAGYFCVASGPQGNARFRVPAMPALCALAGLGLGKSGDRQTEQCRAAA
jgi:4-amino-4-deoxy-L-arabinose transferase-like glycosyltransferase